MSILEILLLSLLALYTLQTLVILIGSYLTTDQTNMSSPPVSILVAARNEENNISRCLESLIQQDYPPERYEIIVINDHSTDNTVRLVNQLRNRIPSLRLLSLADFPPPSVSLAGKQQALEVGFRQAKSEIILCTDADCIVPPNWVKSMASFFQKNSGLVFALTQIEPRGSSSYRLLNIIQRLDLIFLFTVAGGVANLGIPLSCMGNNMAMRKSVYQEIGGYTRIGFSITEDFALVQWIRHKTRWKIHFNSSPSAVVSTNPESSWSAFIHQKKRWLWGGLADSKLMILLLLPLTLFHLILLLTFFAPINRNLGMLIFGIKGLLDFLILFRTTFQFSLAKHWLLFFPVFELYFLLGTIFLGFARLWGTPHIIWKGRNLHAIKHTLLF